MRNPNYKYDRTGDGWTIYHGDPMDILSPSTWGKTKAAARSRLLRLMRGNQRLRDADPAGILQAEKGGTNDQSQ